MTDYKDTFRYDGFITSPYRLWMLVNNVRQLQDMETNLSANYALGRDIEAAETASWNGGAGFAPIGLHTGGFGGQLDGMNRVITGLTIYRPRNDYVGLFSSLRGAVRNLGLLDIDVTANSHAGTFAGHNTGILENSYASGHVSTAVEGGYSESATGTAGGLVGSNGFDGVIRNAYSMVSVDGFERLGGIAGSNSGVIDSVYATGRVAGDTRGDALFAFGGLVGANFGQVTNAYWTTDGTGKQQAFGSDKAPGSMRNSASKLINDELRVSSLALDFDSVWVRYDGYTVPLLRSFLKPLTIDGISRNIQKVYDGSAFDLQPEFLYSDPDAALSGHINSGSGVVIDSPNPDVGSYTSTFATRFWSDQQGYLIEKPLANQTTTGTISARPIIVEASPDTKFFDGSVESSLLPGVSGSIMR